MKANRADSSLEQALRRELHRRGLRFRKHHRPIPGLRCRPDIVFTRVRVAVFVDGCFWHRCPLHATDPVANGAWWREKLEQNVARDRRNDAALRAGGWTVLRLWEHEAVDDMADRVQRTIAAMPPGGPAESPVVDDVRAFLSTAEVAERLRLTPVRVRQLVRSGQLPATRVGGRWLLKGDDVDRFAALPPGRPHHRRDLS